MRFFPNSSGGTQRRAVREINPCHEPGGKATGGQFAKKTSSGCVSAMVAATGQPGPAQPVLTDTKTGQAKFHPPPEPPETPEGLKVERPKGSPKKADAGKDGASKITRFSENEGDADAALDSLGVSMSAKKVAEGMVSAIEGETFTVTVSASGDGGGESYDGPDPDEVRGTYDEWYMERSSEAESEMHSSERSDYVRGSLMGFKDVNTRVNTLIADRIAKGVMHDDAGPERDHMLALAERIYDVDNEFLSDDGGKATRSIRTASGEDDDARLQGIVKDYLDENPDAKFTRLPTDVGDIDDTFDEDYRIERSKYFNDNDGFDNWINDDQNYGAGDDINDFETWYEGEYGHHPDKYGEGGSGGDYDSDDTRVEFNFHGDKGSKITRTFYMDEGELHVHHDYFTAGQTGDGLAKAFYQGALPTYDKMGVQHISTNANIDVGAYAWARFGFQAESPRGLANSLETMGKQYFKDTGLFDEGDWANYQKLISKGKDDSDGSFIWDIADAKFYTTPEKALAILDKLQVGRSYGSAVTFNAKLREEAEKGIVSIGRVMLARGSMSWNGRLELHDDESVRRLEGYVGKWRADKPAAPSSTDPRKQFEKQFKTWNADNPLNELSPEAKQAAWEQSQRGTSFDAAIRQQAVAANLQTIRARRQAAADTQAARGKRANTVTRWGLDNKGVLSDAEINKVWKAHVHRKEPFADALAAAKSRQKTSRQAAAAGAAEAKAYSAYTKRLGQFDKQVRAWDKANPGNRIGMRDSDIFRLMGKGRTFDAAVKQVMRTKVPSTRPSQSTPHLPSWEADATPGAKVTTKTIRRFQRDFASWRASAKQLSLTLPAGTELRMWRAVTAGRRFDQIAGEIGEKLLRHPRTTRKAPASTQPF